MQPDMTSWEFVQIIHGEAAFDNSGISLSLSNDVSTLAVGATLNQANFTSGRGPGHVRVYKKTGSVYTQIGQDIDGTGRGDQFGFSVALSEYGTRLAIGANQLNIGEDEDIGNVQIFQLTNTTGVWEWVQMGDDITGVAFGDQMGDSVSINCKGTIVAVGASKTYDETQTPAVQEAGAVKVYEWGKTTSSWDQIGQTIYGEDNLARIGSSVSLTSSGYVMAVGAPLTQGGPPNVWVYNKGSDVWSILAGDIGGVGGAVVDISADGTTLAIGDPEITET
eukprot:scaffold8329_cov73-Cylindrotheca_fusiformis.AAC.1